MLRSFLIPTTIAMAVCAPAYASTVSGIFSGTIATPTNVTEQTVAGYDKDGQKIADYEFVHSDGGQDTFMWGTMSPSLGAQENNSTMLSVDEGSFELSASSSEPTLLGTITWLNRSNWLAGGSWDGSFTFMLDIDNDAVPNPLTQTVDFSITNTADLTMSVEENESSDATPDFITGLQFPDGAFGTPISLGNNLVLTGVSFGVLDGGTVGTDGSLSNYASWFDAETGIWENNEGSTSVIGVYATVASVPLPAGVWLMLSGFGGLMLMRKRTKQIA